MEADKTHLRVKKTTKARLVALFKETGYSAELLADLLLTDALDQIDDDLTPTEILPHVGIVRKRLGRRMETMPAVAMIDRWLVSQGRPALSDTLSGEVSAAPTLRAAEDPPPKRHGK